MWMDHASSIYLHIINGEAGAAGELMARLALHLGHDAQSYPLEVTEVAQLRLISKEKGWLTEHYAAEMLRAAVFGSFQPWSPDEVERLASMLARH